MQQDRSTGWRLGTPRTIQFRFQVMGIVVGAVISVGFAQLFMTAYPVLKLDQTVMSAAEQPAQWSSAMTYKFVGALRGITDDQPHQRSAIWLGVALGFAFQAARKWLFSRPGYQRWKARGSAQANADFVLDAVLLPSPYAFSFGCFLGLATSAWFAVGGIVSSAVATLAQRRRRGADDGLPSDMSSTSLIGGGLIAGDALAALGLGMAGLLATVLA
jgi:uncharacterized oligopeptide transporter (OPT) family protein